jgi:hypothetical protein
MTGLEPLVVGYLSAWAVRKARRVGDRVDGSVDQVLDILMDRLDTIVRDRIGAAPAIIQFEEEAANGSATSVTSREAEVAIADAVSADEQFGYRLRALTDEIRAAATPQQVAVYAKSSGHAKMPVLGSGTQHNTFS